MFTTQAGLLQGWWLVLQGQSRYLIAAPCRGVGLPLEGAFPSGAPSEPPAAGMVWCTWACACCRSARRNQISASSAVAIVMPTAGCSCPGQRLGAACRARVGLHGGVCGRRGGGGTQLGLIRHRAGARVKDDLLPSRGLGLGSARDRVVVLGPDYGDTCLAVLLIVLAAWVCVGLSTQAVNASSAATKPPLMGCALTASRSGLQRPVYLQ